MRFTDDYDYANDVWLIKCRECGVSMTREAYAYGHDCEVAYEMSSVEADADTLASAGHGTDEDYGYYGD